MDRDASTTDEYLMTALQIFDYCGANSDSTLRVDALMDKFAPFIKTNKSEYSFLKSLLDPEQSNPEINVSKLTRALTQYSESQKSKVDLDESFNLKSGSVPQDSDSGISTDGFQLLEDLQSELREKAHLAHQLRSQLDFTDRQHEEALAAVTAERDSLQVHVNMLRDENLSLTHSKQDYEEACERLCSLEQALAAARRDFDGARRRGRVLTEQVASLENEKLSLQELLTKSKDECHRINEMYSSRQCALREENETLKAEHADLSTRLQDQEDFMQQVIKEKVMLEMELKELLNKSNHTQLRLDRSIDVSYTEDQMLTALDTLTADSRFNTENRILDEESFLNALKEDQGRFTNVSLFDEMRFSLSNMSKHSFTDSNDINCDKCMESCDRCTEYLEVSLVTIGTQTDEGFSSNCDVRETKDVTIQTDETLQPKTDLISIDTQTEFEDYYDNNNCTDCMKCLQCDKLKEYAAKLETDLKNSNTNMTELRFELDKYEDNLGELQKILDEGHKTNNFLQTIVNGLQGKIGLLEAVCEDQKHRIDSLCPDTCSADCQTSFDQTSVSTQAEAPCVDCEKRKAVVPQKSLRRYLWEPLKCLFQVFAVVSFLCAISVLYGVTRRWNTRCDRDTAAVPWRWLDASDLMDLLLRIEYVADVPM